MAAPTLKRDITFRQNEIRYILSKLMSGDSCSVVGVGNVGKSNLIKHLLRPETQAYHLSEQSELSMVLVDAKHMLASIPYPHDLSNSGWAGYELLLHRLYKQFYPFSGLAEEDIQQIAWAIEKARDFTNPGILYVVPRYLEAILEILMRESNTQLVLIFNDFGDILHRLPPLFFQHLRGLRDDYKYRLMYATFSQQSLPQIIAENPGQFDSLQFEPFVELFTDSTIYLGPYSESDAIAMLDALSARKETAHPPSFRNFLLRMSGRFAGLLRASFDLANQIEFGTHESEALRFLSEQRAIQTECRIIWESLSYEERLTLKRLADGEITGLDDMIMRLLREKFLLIPEENTWEITPPLFREYVARFAQLSESK